ncbi:hypothetical protein [Mycobacterium uberis]|uniref:hypothetical protein n=1 Tax=Mycobacterium uberis TaxID=2162698 RepID=UPI003C75577C
MCRAIVSHLVTRDTVIVADPFLRSGGRRCFCLVDCRPSLGKLLYSYRDRDFIIEFASSIDFGQVCSLGFAAEIEVTLYHGSVRKTYFWSAELVDQGVCQRASILDSTEQVADAEPDGCSVRPAGQWIIDPNGVVVRVGLVHALRCVAQTVAT